jgi:beta-1,4-mannosyltransferase
MWQLDVGFVAMVFGTIGTTIFVAYMLFGPDSYRYPAKDAKAVDKGVSVQVLVLGDLGRSPRMTYHAMSIAEHGGRVDLIGYLG